MKICVVGAGAIGGMIAVRLAEIGHEVTAVVRGANLEAVRRNGGMSLLWEDGSRHFGKMRATDRPAEAGPQDHVILALKAHQLVPLVDQIPALLGPDTSLVTMQNGIPFWYFHNHGGEFAGRAIDSVDPGGFLLRMLEPDRIIGTIVYPAAEIAEPGLIRHIEGNRFSFGELDGTDSERVRSIAEAMRQAGFKAPVVSDLRGEIWLKLWGNMSFNPISALTHATLEDVCRFPETRALCAHMMEEAQAIGERLGVRFKVSIDRRIAGAEAVGPHKTSMLQDIEQGRPIELEALVGSLIELGRLTGLPTPHIDAVYACAKLLDRTVQERRGTLRLTGSGQPEAAAAFR